MLYRSFLLSIFLLSIISFSNAQGCSDAGACSIGDIKTPGRLKDSLTSNALTIGINYGIGEEETTILTPYLQYERNLSFSFSVLAKLTAAFSNGIFGDNAALGDLYLAGNYTYRQGPNTRISLIGGIKVPLNNADERSDKGVILPMQYQSSLGTVDLLIGLGVGFGQHFEVSVAGQVPVVNNNKNESFYKVDNGSYIPLSFERKADVLLRMGYTVNLSKKFSIKPNILGIYHTANDILADSDGVEEPIEKSAGLTLNLGIIATYNANEYSQLEFILGAPAVVREERPDGLTRSFVAGLQYRMAF